MMKEEFTMSMYASKDDLLAAMRSHIDFLQSRLEGLNQKVAALQQENASLKEDSARYRRVLLSARGYGSESWSEWLANEVDDALVY